MSYSVPSTETHTIKAILALIAVLLLAGCTARPSYVKPAISDPAGYATIQGSEVADTWPVSNQYTTIVGIDGSVPRGMDYDQPIEVSPGEHTIVVQFTHGERRAGLQTTVNFSAGKSYVAKAKEVGSSWLELGQVDIVIEETDTQQIVAQGTARVDYQIPVRVQ
ncbi:MAG: hypothetical protein AAF637_15905 [Pseudomonadota bacterium]